jgi:DNA-binding CsgD family transcriptional regulator
MRLIGRHAECEALDQLVTDTLSGQSRVIVLRGEAGAGKSALLGHLSECLEGWHVARAVGVESEMELAYSGLHQLCAPMLDRLDLLPAPQRASLATVFGLNSGPAPDRFLVGLATLTLLAEVAEEQPLVCIVDDAQWLDRASAQLLGFVARRLLAERVAFVCAARIGSQEDVFAGLPELPVRGLGDSDARALLLDNVHGPLDAAVCEQIVTESHGNPLALLELPRTWNAADLAGGFGLPGNQPVAGRIEQSYARRILELPAETQLLVLAAAAEPLGDTVLLHRASESLGVDMAAAAPAVDAGLVSVVARVEFAHPLVRSAAYHSAAADDRYRVHRALADATDAETDPDRRAWHRARGTPGPAEDVAAELERSAGRAQARGGVAAEAAFLQRAVALTVDPARRIERALAAAQASARAGAFDAALGLLATAEAGPLDAYQQARVDTIRGHIAFASGLGSDAPPLLLKAARRLESFDVELARETYLNALGAALVAGTEELPEICRAARALPPTREPRAVDLLLDGLALLVTEGHRAAAPTLQEAATALVEISAEDVLRWGWMATGAAAALWDYEGLLDVAARTVELIRDAGALAQLPIPLAVLGASTVWSGDFAAATTLIAEADGVASATGIRMAPFTALRLRTLQGREADAADLITRTIEDAGEAGRGVAATNAHWVAAVLYNGLSRYDDALAAARQATADELALYDSMWALPELVEAAARSGHPKVARRALERLAETTQPSGTDFGLGIEARCRAMLEEGSAAEEQYQEAIARLGRTPLRPELARAHLLFGEWLRREGMRIDAREQLHTAHDMCAAIGMEAFAERARRELVASGEKVRKRGADTRDELTPQEEQIARLARDGLSNPEIGAMLFLSPRTVEWHLRKVFAKLGIRSRSGLRTTLSTHEREATPA